MADQLKWGIIATGSIAKSFAKGVNASKTGTLYGAASRTLERATEFTDEFGGKPFGSYQELLDDPEVDAVYIATPHHLHAEWTINAARAGKAILCEKPFTLNAVEAEKALAVVKETGVFFMEAFMYRCHPQTILAKEILDSGKLGKILAINGEFAFQAGHDWDNFRTTSSGGGGGLMDVGVYPISMSRFLIGEEPIKAAYMTPLNDKGYDGHGVGSMLFPGGAAVMFGTGIHVDMRNDVTVYCTNGRLHMSSPWFGNDSKLTVTVRGAEPEVHTFEDAPNLYAGEADAVAHFIEKGECPYMTPQDTLGNMRTLDALRASADYKFDGEVTA